MGCERVNAKGKGYEIVTERQARGRGQEDRRGGGQELLQVTSGEETRPLSPAVQESIITALLFPNYVLNKHISGTSPAAWRSIDQRKVTAHIMKSLQFNVSHHVSQNINRKLQFVTAFLVLVFGRRTNLPKALLFYTCVCSRSSDVKKTS